MRLYTGRTRGWEGAPGREKKRMCQQSDGGADWPSGCGEREYLEGNLERGGGDVEHVHGCWGRMRMKRIPRKE